MNPASLHRLPAFAAPRAGYAARRSPGLGLGIVLLHAAVIWALLQAPAVRPHLPAAEPVVVRLIALATVAPAVLPPKPVPAVVDRPPQLQREGAPPTSQPALAAKAEQPLELPRTTSPLAAPAPAVDAPAPAAVAAAEPVPAPAAPPPTPATATALEVPPAAPAAPKQIPASAVQYQNRVLPVYSPASVRAREAGRVVARVLIDEAGQPRTVQLQQSSRYLRLDEACTAAVRLSRFRPYTENGQPTAGWALVPCDFEL